jgi:hypothetical protein
MLLDRADQLIVGLAPNVVPALAMDHLAHLSSWGRLCRS